LTEPFKLLRDIDPEQDHVRGGGTSNDVAVVSYGDFLCPYCRRFRAVLKRLRQALGDRLAYTYRHFPNEPAHPGAEFLARASEAAAKQDRFWEMHDALFDREPPLGRKDALAIARELGLDMDRFERDLEEPDLQALVEEDLADARRNGVTGTPTLFVDGVRYDGAWDFYSLLDVLERPVSERIQRSARAFASLPAAGGLVLILAAIAALLAANSPLASAYHAFIGTSFGIGPPRSLMSLTVGEWLSEGLLAFFFLLVGLEIRREMTAGTLSDRKSAALPILAAIGAAIVPAVIYLLFNRGASAAGWSVPTATDIAFALAVLALLGDRVPSSAKVFVAAFAVVDDIVSVLTLAVFYPHNLQPVWLTGALAAMAMMFALNRWRVYANWPYAAMAIVVWFCLHSAGVHGALAGVVLAGFIPTRPPPEAGPLLAQAATALAALEHAQKSPDADAESPVLDWASRNLSAASERLLSPADRVERAVAPWSTYVVLPLFAFAAAGVPFNVDLSGSESASILAGVILGLVIGKPLGICATAWIATRLDIARMPEDLSLRLFLGAACLCGIGDTMALLLADQAFVGNPRTAAIAKIGVLIGSLLAAALGAIVIMIGQRRAQTEMAANG
jgi:NhaA family Na+:H+ antiporter